MAKNIIKDNKKRGLVPILIVLAAVVIPVTAMLISRNRPAPVSAATATYIDRQEVTHTLQLEIADSASEQATGLMNHTALPADHGMLFVFTKSQLLSFWMLNTHISLDIIFLDSASQVLDVHSNTTPDQTETIYSSSGLALYALEANGGWAQSVGLQVGDNIQLQIPVANE